MNAFEVQLAMIPSTQRRSHLESTILRVVHELTGEASAAIDSETPLMEAGIDSLAATELSSQLRALTSMELSSTIVFDHPTSRAIAAHVLDAANHADAKRTVSAFLEDSLTVTASYDSTPWMHPVVSRWPGGSGDAAHVHRLLQAAGDATSKVPLSRWRFYGQHVCERGGFLVGVQLFDRSRFMVSAAECGAMDPQQRLLLELGYTALHKAAHRRSSISGSSTGIFVGIEHLDWQHLQVLLSSRTALQQVSAYTATGREDSAL